MAHTGDGRAAPAGILFCRLESGGWVLKQKMARVE
jgi:hypothetical protein